MSKPIYYLEQSTDGHFFFFESIGKKIVQKAIGYIPFEENPNIVELVFGDLNKDNTVDFMNVSDNEDMVLILSTVIASINEYLADFPTKTIYFRGSSPSRTRLYRAVISKYSKSNELFYDIFGISENEQAEIFNKEHTYIGYLIRKKHEK